MSPSELAGGAAEFIRSLNHALYAGFTTPGDAYSLVGELSRLVSMLPQALDMTRQAVEKLERDGNLYSDHKALADDLARTYDGLARAARDAQALYESIAPAHAGLGHIGMQDGAQ